MSLRDLVAKHLPGEHDQSRHGSWAAGLAPDAMDFEVQDAADAWGRSFYRDWRAGLDEEESSALGRYQASGYDLINASLRGLAGTAWIPPTLPSHIALLDQALAKAPPLTEDLLVYRAVDKLALKGVRQGQTFVDQGFVSTTLVETVAQRFTGRLKFPLLAVIRVPKGTRAGYLERREGIRNENELLLPRGLRFRLVSRHAGKHQSGEYVELEVVP